MLQTACVYCWKPALSHHSEGCNQVHKANCMPAGTCKYGNFIRTNKNNKLHLLILFWNNGTLCPTKQRSNWKIPLFTDATDQILFLPSYFTERANRRHRNTVLRIVVFYIYTADKWLRGNAFVRWFCINASDRILSKQHEKKNPLCMKIIVAIISGWSSFEVAGEWI